MKSKAILYLMFVGFLTIVLISPALGAHYYATGTWDNSTINDQYKTDGIYGKNHVYNVTVNSGFVAEFINMMLPLAADGSLQWIQLGWDKGLEPDGVTVHHKPMFYIEWNISGAYSYSLKGDAEHCTTHSYKINRTGTDWLVYIDDTLKETITSTYQTGLISAQSESTDPTNELTGHFLDLKYYSSGTWNLWDKIRTYKNNPYWVEKINSHEFKTGPPKPSVPTIESSDSSGKKKDTFIKDDKVYANGSGYSKEIKTYKLYITNDATWTDKKSIASAGIIVTKDVTTDAQGNISTTLIWEKAKIGKYDIVVDVNGNGKYDTSCDALDDKDVGDAGFVVQLPDLTVKDISWEPEEICPCDNVTFTANVSNEGKCPVNDSFDVCFWVNGELINTTRVNTTIAPNSSVNVSVVWHAEVPCNHTVRVKADCNDEIDEHPDESNKLQEDFEVQGPDLTVKDISWEPEEICPCDNVTFTANVSNEGKCLVNDSFDVCFWVNGELINTTRVNPPIAPNSSVNVSVVWHAEVPCNYTIRVKADCNDEIDEHPDKSNELQEDFDVQEDFGDAPDKPYPSKLASNGARHSVFAFEWLGKDVNGEHDSKQVDRDEHDDGVRFVGTPKFGSPFRVIVRVNTSGLGAARYRADDKLYLNAWVDWNVNGEWESFEKIIEWNGGPGLNDVCTKGKLLNPATPWPVGNNSRVLEFDVTVPVTTIPEGRIGKPYYSRFRLDYDENVNTTTGPAKFGEVEDHDLVDGEWRAKWPTVLWYVQKGTKYSIEIFLNKTGYVTRVDFERLGCPVTEIPVELAEQSLAKLPPGFAIELPEMVTETMYKNSITQPVDVSEIPKMFAVDP